MKPCEAARLQALSAMLFKPKDFWPRHPPVAVINTLHLQIDTCPFSSTTPTARSTSLLQQLVACPFLSILASSLPPFFRFRFQTPPLASWLLPPAGPEGIMRSRGFKRGLTFLTTRRAPALGPLPGHPKVRASHQVGLATKACTLTWCSAQNTTSIRCDFQLRIPPDASIAPLLPILPSAQKLRISPNARPSLRQRTIRSPPRVTPAYVL